jgi:ankyrin repeat protein
MAEILDASFRGDVDAVAAILAAEPGAWVARDESLGTTPLIVAAHRGFAAVVELLLGAGAEVDARERVSDSTALHWAAEGGHPAVLERLLAAGARVDVVDGWFGLGPLGWATVIAWAPDRWADRAGAAALLLARGAAIDPFAALALGRLDAVDVGARLGFAGRGRTPLHVAARERPEAVAPLLARGADPLALDDRGVSPLAEAILRGRRDLFPAALEPDASACLVSGEPVGAGAVPPGLLAWAAELGRADAIRALLAAGAAVDARVRGLSGEIPSQLTALHIAAESRHRDAVAALLDGGADPDARCEATHKTPLHFAVASGAAAVVTLLLAEGADATLRDRTFGATPRGWAEFDGDAQIVALFA